MLMIRLKLGKVLKEFLCALAGFLCYYAIAFLFLLPLSLLFSYVALAVGFPFDFLSPRFLFGFPVVFIISLPLLW